MAIALTSIDINRLEDSGRALIPIALTNWSSGTPQLASGSVFDCAGGIYKASSDTDLGTVGEWGAIANSTLCWSYFSPVDLAMHWTTTAPTYSTSKISWYGTGGSATYRYLVSCFKGSAGAYEQVTILLDREHGITYTGLNMGSAATNGDHIIRVATDASIMWDESEDQFKIDKNIDDIKSYYVATSGAGTDLISVSLAYNASSSPFVLKKSITGYLSGGGQLQTYQNSGWRTVYAGFGTITYNVILNPGYYRFLQDQYAGATTCKLVCVGVLGATEILATEIVT